MDEIWKPIEGFENRYFVSNLGKVKSHTGKILGHIKRDNCLRIVLKGKGQKQTRISLHRLVAHYFLDIDFRDRTIIIQHKDGDIYNNHVENLKILERINEKGTIQGEESKKSSGIRNIVWHSPTSKWAVRIRIRRKHFKQFKHIGYFNTLEEAIKVYRLWDPLRRNAIHNYTYPGLTYIESENKWRVDVFDPEGNVYHIDNYNNEAEALEDWKMYHEILNHKH